MQKILLSGLVSLLVSATLQAKSCYNAKEINVEWTSYKTMAKIGVSGNFSKTKLLLKNNATSSVKDMLKDATLKLNLKDLDAHLAVKNSNIAEFFTANLQAKDIEAKIVAVQESRLIVSIRLNNKTQQIPMTYSSQNSQIIAKGVIDALDFDLVPALRVLNKNVAGHKNKGWNDISISFDMPYTTTCK